MSGYFDRVVHEARRKIPNIREQAAQTNYRSGMIYSESPGTQNNKAISVSNSKSQIEKPQFKSIYKKPKSANNQLPIDNKSSIRQKMTANKKVITQKIVDKNPAVPQETIQIKKRVVTSDKLKPLNVASVQKPIQKTNQTQSQIDSNVLSTADKIELNIGETTNQKMSLSETKNKEEIPNQTKLISERDKTAVENMRSNLVSDELNQQKKSIQKPAELVKTFKQEDFTKQPNMRPPNNHNSVAQNKGVHIGEVRVQIIEDNETLTSRRVTGKRKENNRDSCQLLRTL